VKELSTAIEIHAPAERVWAILTDFEHYPEWNPFVRRVEGKARVGSQLEVRMQPEGGRAMTFRPKLLRVEPERELRWLGRLFVRGLFDGEHIFRLEPLADGRIRFEQRELFRGLLVPVLSSMLDRGTRPAFEAMNRALKERAESATENSSRSPAT
jgi:hypothetical protein